MREIVSGLKKGGIVVIPNLSGYEVYIRATPEEVWRALTDSELTNQYYYENTVESDWKPGSPMTYRNPDGSVAIECNLDRHGDCRQGCHEKRPRQQPSPVKERHIAGQPRERGARQQPRERIRIGQGCDGDSDAAEHRADE